jgi:hypothetical protein
MSKERAELLSLLLNAVIVRWDDTSIVPFAVNLLEWGISINESGEETRLFTVQDAIQWIEMRCD